MFKFFLVDEAGDVHDPAGFVTAVRNWSVGETFVLRRAQELAPAIHFRMPTYEKLRILEIRTEIAPELLEAGFNGVFVVEPAGPDASGNLG